ncbi:hypothetical protein [Anaeromyxobacter sp. Fw109-5]|nr:hypothetical protein [Anaeromyxobacter sp. Fw109-5]
MRRGTTAADVVIVLFTPDKLAVLNEQLGREAPGDGSLPRCQVPSG